MKNSSLFYIELYVDVKPKNENTLELIRVEFKENEIKSAQNIVEWEKKHTYGCETGVRCRKVKPRVEMNYKKKKKKTLQRNQKK